MRTPHWLLKGFAILTLVSLSLTLMPVQAQTPAAPETDSVYSDTIGTLSAIPVSAAPAGRSRLFAPPLQGEAPEAYFDAWPTEGVAPLEVEFYDESTPEGEIESWLWDFGDGVTSTIQYPTHTYTVAGSYAVSLTVWISDTSDTEVRPDYIFVDELQADFDAEPTEGYAPLEVQFWDESTPEEEIESWLWEFGDEETSEEQNPTHVYEDPGVYTVTLPLSSFGLLPARSSPWSAAWTMETSP